MRNQQCASLLESLMTRHLIRTANWLIFFALAYDWVPVVAPNGAHNLSLTAFLSKIKLIRPLFFQKFRIKNLIKKLLIIFCPVRYLVLVPQIYPELPKIVPLRPFFPSSTLQALLQLYILSKALSQNSQFSEPT